MENAFCVGPISVWRTSVSMQNLDSMPVFVQVDDCERFSLQSGETTSLFLEKGVHIISVFQGIYEKSKYFIEEPDKTMVVDTRLIARQKFTVE